MTPNASLRFRRTTAFVALFWSLIAFVLLLHSQLAPSRYLALPVLAAGFPASEVIQAVGEDAAAVGIEPGDFLVAIDGEPVDERTLARVELQRGRSNHYDVRKRNGTRIQADLPPVPRGSVTFPFAGVARVGMALVAWIYLTIGVVVWRLRHDRSESWALLLFSCVMASEFFLTVPQLMGVVTPTGTALSALNGPLIGATAFHLFTTYPIQPSWILRHPQLRVVPYVLAFAVGVHWLLAPAEALGGNTTPAFFVTMVLAAACMITIFVERRRLGQSGTSDRADVMLLGAMVSFGPILVMLAAQYSLRAVFPWPLTLLFFFVFPLAVGYGIVAKELFEIRMVARSSVVHGAATIAITGLYAFLITVAEAGVKRFSLEARSEWFAIAFLFFAILAFNPLRNRLQGVVDRIFDRDRAAYRQAVREISEAMVSMLSVKEVVDRILLALTDTMGVERAMVLLFDEDERHLKVESSRGDVDPEALGETIPADHPIVKQLWVRRDELSRLGFDDEPDADVREQCRDVFDSFEVELLVPILYGVDLLGAIAVGRKISGERLSVDDRQLLRTLSNQSSIAIENARAFDEIAALNETLEARVEERTAELQEMQNQLLHSEKMRSLGQLVAGVAHELNNPIGFVHANLQLLDEYVKKLVAAQARNEDTTRIREAIAKLLSRSREGTERVKKIVQDLRTFSRMDQAEVQEADLNAEIESTLTLMEPRFKDGITIERDLEDLPPVRCFAGQLNQVFMNLIMNACDAMGGEGTLRISSRRLGNDGVRLEFQDDGPGIPPEIQSRIFEPFFTTKGVGQGTGLGLSLSHGIIERHGGRMLVFSEEDRGTTFVIELPLEPRDVE